MVKHTDSSKFELTGRTSDFLKIGVAAAGRGDIEAVKQLLRLKPDWLHRVGSHGRTMLWEAAYRGRIEMVAYLIERGADIDVCGCHFTPLLVDISAYCAAKFKRHESTAILLLEFGARIDFFTDVYLGNYDCVNEQLNEDSSLAIQEKAQNDRNVKATALHYAVSQSRTRILDLLLRHGADPQPYSFWLVRFAIWRKNTEVLERLFRAGVDPSVSAIPRSGITDPLINALLDRYGVPFDPDVAEGGWPALVYSARGDRGGNLKTIRELLAQGADVNQRNYKGQTALHCAAKAGFGHIVKELLQQGAQVDAVDENGDTPLLTAVRSTIKDKQNLFAVAKTLVSAGADLSSKNMKGHSPMSVASRKANANEWLICLSMD
ncbi:MAG: ankyrin repeat domain-containing protein [Gammaproteobacteria bacterium]|nr:ankyrin repeat domain-containing protein [Gammaproteobacteria bacterium]